MILLQLVAIVAHSVATALYAKDPGFKSIQNIKFYLIASRKAMANSLREFLCHRRSDLTLKIVGFIYQWMYSVHSPIRIANDKRGVLMPNSFLPKTMQKVKRGRYPAVDEIRLIQIDFFNCFKKNSFKKKFQNYIFLAAIFLVYWLLVKSICNQAK